ncbi:MAG: DUF2752 domain-containing protein [Aeromicrobium sp.]
MRGAPAASRLRAVRMPVLLAAAGLGLAAMLRTRDPHVSGSYGFCPFRSLTGLPCPGCGGLRAVNDLTRGDVVAAASSNAMTLLLVAAVFGLWVVWVVRRAAGDSEAVLVRVSTRAALAVLAAFAVFGVLRVTPWGAWLAP